MWSIRFINIMCVLIAVFITIHEATGISFPESWWVSLLSKPLQDIWDIYHLGIHHQACFLLCYCYWPLVLNNCWVPFLFDYPTLSVNSLIKRSYLFTGASQVVQVVKNPPWVQETQGTRVQSLGREDPGEGSGGPLQYSCLVTPVDEGPGVQSMGSQGVRHDWGTKHSTLAVHV